MRTSSDIRQRYALWVADYSSARPNGYSMWQKSSEGKIDGIKGNVDLDEAYEDYPSLIKNAGLNGFDKSHRITVIIDGETIIKDYRF